MNKILAAIVASTFALGSVAGYAADSAKKEELTKEQKTEMRDRAGKLNADRAAAPAASTKAATPVAPAASTKTVTPMTPTASTKTVTPAETKVKKDTVKKDKVSKNTTKKVRANA